MPYLRKMAFVCCLIISLVSAVSAAPFHEQTPMTHGELQNFAKDFPLFKAWIQQSHALARPSVSEDGLPTFIWDSATANWIQTHTNWTPKRFFYVMTHSAAALTILDSPHAPVSSDMPQISDYERNLVHENELTIRKTFIK